ncbi:hypothetical protein DDB_G0286047 [Dictyostelium discoideum AX4]|uniref:Uncharacterized protein n=1 Tax=Dictyostelium discoideum TaxID=44689 RepID=Q54MC1_DICDI|nr:hypothetical protein DDB_G0286047 [Dictyostelium discoideum AX4]EAL64402.1 hypothetical protein DDB_G0286047 [Dictyostelium discoideum AX4]|eukprot:XP_637913.1 hypothetical protein DDB_G0286047 [Dictyostelium discoideum AX4]
MCGGSDIELPKPSELSELEIVSGLSKQWWLYRSIDNNHLMINHNEKVPQSSINGNKEKQKQIAIG